MAFLRSLHITLTYVEINGNMGTFNSLDLSRGRYQRRHPILWILLYSYVLKVPFKF